MKSTCGNNDSARRNCQTQRDFKADDERYSRKTTPVLRNCGASRRGDIAANAAGFRRMRNSYQEWLSDGLGRTR